MMFLPSVSTLLLCVSSQHLDYAREQLFVDWTTSPQIAQVTIGLPTEDEIDGVLALLHDIREEFLLHAPEELTNTQRDVDVPFLLAMIDGVLMETDSTFAKSCNAFLIELEDVDFNGIAASRYWRMRHRSAVLLGDERGALETQRIFWALKSQHPEDRLVLTLFEIQQSFHNGDINQGRSLYDKETSRLISSTTQYLRIPFASAYARIAPTLDESVRGWFALADWLVAYGCDQEVVDIELSSWMSRMSDKIEISEQSAHPRIASFAVRRGINKNLRDNEDVAVDMLMELARTGDGRSAERVLEIGDLTYKKEALELLFSFPNNLKAPIEYWHLHAAILDFQNDELEKACERLRPIANSGGVYALKARALLETITNKNQLIIQNAFVLDKVSAIPTQLAENYNLSIVQDLLQQCNHLYHTEGKNKWNSAALSILLGKADGVAPYILAEAYRLHDLYDQSIPLFNLAIDTNGPTVQTTAGLAVCTRDAESMRRIVHSTSPDDASSFWYWLANVKLIQWYIEDGGDQTQVIAKINRLRKKDASLGGVQFMAQFNTMID